MTRPLTPSERVAKARSKAIQNGGRRVEVILPPQAARNLDDLIVAHYADSVTVAIARALYEARERLLGR